MNQVDVFRSLKLLDIQFMWNDIIMVAELEEITYPWTPKPWNMNALIPKIMGYNH